MQGSVNNTHKGLDLEEDQDAGNSAFSGGYKSFAEEIDPSPKPFTNPFAVEQSSPQPDQKVQAGLINQVQEAMTRDVSQTQILNTSQNLVASVSTGTVQNNSDTMKDGIKAAQQLQNPQPAGKGPGLVSEVVAHGAAAAITAFNPALGLGLHAALLAAHMSGPSELSMDLKKGNNKRDHRTYVSSPSPSPETQGGGASGGMKTDIMGERVDMGRIINTGNSLAGVTKVGGVTLEAAEGMLHKKDIVLDLAKDSHHEYNHRHHQPAGLHA